MSNERNLACLKCLSQFAIQTVLQCCSMSWPNRRWALFSCPTCLQDSHLEFRDDVIAIGMLDGDPGPCFIPHKTVGVPGLQVAATAIGMTITVGDLVREVPAK